MMVVAFASIFALVVHPRKALKWAITVLTEYTTHVGIALLVLGLVILAVSATLPSPAPLPAFLSFVPRMPHPCPS